MNIYTLKIVDIKSETDDTKTICFKQPGLKKVKYLAGQYLTLIFRINGRRYMRPYSFSSTPLVDQNLEITVKRIVNGIVSNHIHDVLQIGDSVEVIPPMGDFTYSSNLEDHEVFFWGAGSGITPLMSIIKQLIHHNEGIKLHLAYINRNCESVIFADQINALTVSHPDRFKVKHFHSQLSETSSPPYVVQRRLKREDIIEIMNDKNAATSYHYICGPLGLKQSITTSLLELNVPQNNIFSEDFELVKDPAQFEGIITQTVLIGYGGEIYELEIGKGKSILESALNSGVELPYSCQTGSCSTCKAKLKSGQLKMIGLSEVRTDLSTDEYLLCCSHPISNDVYIEV